MRTKLTDGEVQDLNLYATEETDHNFDASEQKIEIVIELNVLAHVLVHASFTVATT